MGPVPDLDKVAWVENALRYSVSNLVHGLELLEVEIAPRLDTLAQHRPIHLIAGGMDSVVSPELTLWLERELNPQSIQMQPEMSHWPFSGDWAMPV